MSNILQPSEPDDFEPESGVHNTAQPNPKKDPGNESPRSATEMPLPSFDAESNNRDTSPTDVASSTIDSLNRSQEPSPDWPAYVSSLADEPQEPSEEHGPNGWQMAWAVIREVGETILLTLIIFLLIQTVIRNFRVVGTSMVDNLHDGQYLIIDKLSYNPLITNVLGVGGPRRGDVVVFEPPHRPGEDYVKRIIALPGETVEIKNGRVYINGQPLEEPFQPRPISYTMPPRVVPEGMVFVLGDNRNNSNDSHNWGPLPIENIVGRAWISYWPPDRWGLIPRDAPTEQATLKHFLNELVPSANAGSE